MKPKSNQFLACDVQQDASGVHVVSGHRSISYSDGLSSEAYLAEVLRSVSNLRSDSPELVSYQKDWPSEYHLSMNRSVLLRDFQFKPDAVVLEVGCGCGAITRFLGETFSQVVAIEGSLARARLAKLRTQDLDNVEIVCGKFQDITFKSCFDIVFCIGVYEYSNKFVDGPNPYEEVLMALSKLLHPSGVLVLAIENQYGLKYFCSSAEDHTGVMFDGIEGYPTYRRNARTFGYNELKRQIAKYFPDTEFFFPFPDYKVPRCVISEEMLAYASVDGLIGSMASREYEVRRRPLFQEQFAWGEIVQNKMLPYFANSFLVLASKENVKNQISKDWLGVMYNTNRKADYWTATKFRHQISGDKVRVCKEKYFRNSEPAADIVEQLTYEEDWIEGTPVSIEILRNVKRKDIEFVEIFEPANRWLGGVRKLSEKNKDEEFVEGDLIDGIWSNSVLDGDDVLLIDKEWRWAERISLRVLLIRSAYLFLYGISHFGKLHKELRFSTIRMIVKKIGYSLGVEIRDLDIREFIEFEVRYQEVVTGRPANALRREIRFNMIMPLAGQRIYKYLRSGFHYGYLKKKRKMEDIILNMRSKLNKK